MIMITRYLKTQIQDVMHKGKVVILYGARRTGKTTLVKEILAQYGSSGRYLNCELTGDRKIIQNPNEQELFSYLKEYKVVVIDEAQVIPNIGKILKILVDTFPQIQIIATGSSSFDLANKVGEPLTGRSRHFMMLPLSLSEMQDSGLDRGQVESRLNSILRFGSMPSVFDLPENLATVEITEIASDYLYKDILIHENLKRSDLLDDLLEALALQLGGEVSYRELARTLNTSPQTIKNYIELLEKCFIIFRLRTLSRNPRKELEVKQSRKIYFYDLGIRNSIIRNFNTVNLRTDIGGLWENFCILELMKKMNKEQIYYNQYFWRTKTDLKEVDLILDYGGSLKAFEFKWASGKNPQAPKAFSEFYKDASYTVINSTNFWSSLL